MKSSFLSTGLAAFSECIQCQNSQKLKGNCWIIAVDFGANPRLMEWVYILECIVFKDSDSGDVGF